MTNGKQDQKLLIPGKIVGLIASVVAILACIIGAVTWISVNMANNAVSIEVLQQRQKRHETLITKNAEILNQHARLLSIIERQGDQLNVLNTFMTKGGRFTEQDGKILHDEVQKVKDRLQHYAVLETELSWIKESIARMETNISKRFDSLHKKLDVAAKK